jgi:uncharacterized protein YjiS (DUF1127 family)
MRRVERVPDHATVGVSAAARLDLAHREARRARRDDHVGRYGAGARIVRRLFDAVCNLRIRSRERRMPLKLDNHVLRDIGLARAECRFLLISRAVTVPDRSQKQQETSRLAARLLSTFQA